MMAGAPAGDVFLQDFAEEVEHRVRDTGASSPYPFARDRVNAVIDALTVACEGVALLAEQIQSFLPREHDRLKAYRYRDLIDIQRLTNNVTGSIPSDLYFFVLDVQEDLGLDHLDMVLVSGEEFRSSGLSSYCHYLEDLNPGLVPEEKGNDAKNVKEKFQELAADVILIDVPRGHHHNPHAWVLIAHECFHRLDGIAELADELPGFNDAIPTRKSAEVIVDLLTFNYVGPPYCYMLIDLPRQSGAGTGVDHPSAKVRWAYLSRLTDWYLDRTDPESQHADLLNPLLSSTEGTLTEAIEDADIAVTETDEAILGCLEDNMEEVQDIVLGFLEDRDIERWDVGLARGLRESGIVHFSDFPDVVPRLANQKVLPAAKPTALLNLGLYAEQCGTGPDAVREAIQFTLRKGVVKRKFIG